MFESLPAEARADLEARARGRMQSHADYANLAHLLDTWGENFVRIRYLADEHEDLPAADVNLEGEDWLAHQAPLDEAQLAYYPTELYGFTWALRKHLEHWLDS